MSQDDAKGLDSRVEEMIKADEIRAAFVPGSSKNFYLIEEPWTMLEEPWRIQWYDNRTRSLCEVYPVGVPYPGDKYAMFTVYDEISKVIKNYVFLMNEYHFIAEDEDALIVD
ncbi:hypothetical protein CL97_gp245 [Cronobacter phage CR9]|jgi:hypothetical protein|uniref:Uncharacterized protein n=1 Tax=Cronobacter phage CR9 TaxID=1162290 RepID=M1F2E5_9CAUD|nr:hypothetical protein CL97_gp245 [Cronobacter phage CR9]AFH21129.1 hypothetical protein CR9_245 [Cronobacter phage CR9]